MTDKRFTTIIAVLGVILTAATVLTSWYQYRAADLQARAAIVALMPQLEVRVVTEKVESDVFTDQRLKITSDGGPVYNFSSARLTWFELRQGSEVRLAQPLTGYFTATFGTGRIKGDLQTIVGHRNNLEFVDFARYAEATLG